jgi:hypothetical protein
MQKYVLGEDASPAPEEPAAEHPPIDLRAILKSRFTK